VDHHLEFEILIELAERFNQVCDQLEPRQMVRYLGQVLKEVNMREAFTLGSILRHIILGHRVFVALE